MTLDEAIKHAEGSGRKFLEEAEPCEMTTEEYRQRMMQAFQNANCDELISVCVLPTEKEFEHLEWLLKNHYKKEPCEDKGLQDKTNCHKRSYILRLVNLDLAETNKALLAEHEQLLKLRSKIDKAILALKREQNSEFWNSSFRDGVGYALELLKKNLGIEESEAKNVHNNLQN